MKNAGIIFNGVLLVLIGILFYLHFSSSKPASQKPAVSQQPMPNGNCRIAYFEMDSIENSFSMVKDVKNELSRKEESINSELAKLEKAYREKASDYQGKAASMNQVQSEMATKDIMQMQQTMQSKKKALDEEYQDFYMRKMRDVKLKIEDYLKEYNKDKGYAYIFASDPGLFYYHDTAYNITSDIIKGLNEIYSKK